MRDSSSVGSSSLFFFCLQHKLGRFAVLPTDQQPHEDKEVESLQERADTLMHTCPTVLLVAGAFTSVSTGTSSVCCRGLLMKMLKIRQLIMINKNKVYEYIHIYSLWLVRLYNVFERSLLFSPRLHFFKQKKL